MNKQQIIGIIRHSLTFIGGILVMKGIIDESTLGEVIGGVITLTGTLWSIIEKNKATIFYTAPTAIRTFMKWGTQEPAKHDLSSLR